MTQPNSFSSHVPHISLLNHSMTWCNDISTLLVIDGMFFCGCIGLVYAGTEAEFPLAMYLGITHSLSLDPVVRPFMKLGLQWLGATGV